jgi:ribosomal protein S18 acetylase RimI-like enzyme
MSHLSYTLVPKDLPGDSPQWEKYAWRLRAARLDSLRLHPEYFLSMYEDEVKQPIDFTIGRLKEPVAWTVIVGRSPHEEAARDPDVLLRDETEYVGFCVMVNIATTAPESAAREGVDNSKKDGDWFMAAVYLHTSVRGTGASKKMIQLGLEVIRKASRDRGEAKTVCVTNVLHGNEVALNLYKKVGFEVTDEDQVEEKGGRSVHTTALKMVL